MTKIETFHITPHAARRFHERTVGIEDAKDVVRYHDHKVLQGRGEHGGNIYKFSKCNGKGRLVVIAEAKKSECWIITVYYETV